MQLSKHFKLEEFTKSMTATRKGIDNTPGAGDIKNLENVCYEILEPVRAKFEKPITVTSGYRSETLCEAIGSKKTSQHAKGQAVDFEIAGIPNIQTAYWLQNNVDFDQLILEFYNKDDPASGWVHVSYNESGSNRKQVLTFDGKKYDNGLPVERWQGKRIMWLGAIKLAVQAGSHIYKKKQQTKMLMADAKMLHAEKMSSGELEYKAKIIESNDNGWKDEFVLILISIPMLLLAWSVFSDDPEIRTKLDLFFEYFKNLPYWYQAIFIGVISAIYGLKGADIMRKK